MVNIHIEIAYAPSADHHLREAVQIAAGSSVAQAIAHSQLSRDYPEIINLTKGVFGVKVADTDVLHEGDRVEIYRPLSRDPMQRRKRRAATKQARLRRQR